MKNFRSISMFAVMTLTAIAFAPSLFAQASPRVIPIVAKQFGYSPNEVHLKQGEAVTLVLTTEDVAHGLKSKELQLDAKIVPGAEIKVSLTPQAAGQFTAFCSTLCGSGHRSMKMAFIVE